jgi:hypothetical protein
MVQGKLRTLLKECGLGKQMIDLNRKVTPWVSKFVLFGCICITAILVYMSHKAFAIGNEWTGGGADVAGYLINY